MRLRGLPYSAKVTDIVNLLHDCSIKGGELGVKFCFNEEGKLTGEAYVELCSMEDVERALGHSREHMGRRYIEIFRGLKSQMNWDLRSKEEKVEGGAHVVRLRGLPYGCTMEQVTNFLTGIFCHVYGSCLYHFYLFVHYCFTLGINIAPGGITFKSNPDGTESGMAFVELCSNSDVESALARHRDKIQHR